MVRKVKAEKDVEAGKGGNGGSGARGGEFCGNGAKGDNGQKGRKRQRSRKVIAVSEETVTEDQASLAVAARFCNFTTSHTGGFNLT